MIRSVNFRSPHYAAKLESIKHRKFKFEEKPGLTYLFGPNGSGKSTILRAAAKGSAVPDEGGWSKTLQPLEYAGLGSPSSIDAVRKALQKDGIEVDWDGSASVLLDSTKSDSAILAFGIPTDGMDTEGEGLYGDTVSALFQRKQFSAGEWRQSRLSRLLEYLRSRKFPDLQKLSKESLSHNDVWQNAARLFAEYVTSLKPTGVLTILLDEPDRSLSLPLQYMLHTQVFTDWAKHFQVIIATHSPFAIFNAQATLIDLKDGYSQECAGSLLDAISKT
jgi:predicted ATPase